LQLIDDFDECGVIFLPFRSNILRAFASYKTDECQSGPIASKKQWPNWAFKP